MNGAKLCVKSNLLFQTTHFCLEIDVRWLAIEKKISNRVTSPILKKKQRKIKGMSQKRVIAIVQQRKEED